MRFLRRHALDLAFGIVVLCLTAALVLYLIAALTDRTTVTIDAPAGTCVEVVTNGASVYVPAGCEHLP